MENSNTKDKFLRTSENIGAQICRQAFWKDKQCNWIGRYMDNPYAPSTLANRALGPELYDGTSGIALYLSYLYVITKKENFRMAAEGAINQALSHYKDIDNASRFGFYSGCLGIAYAAVKIGTMLNIHTVVDQGLKLFKQLQSERKSEHLMDVISGNAGAIPALLEMYDCFDEKSLYDLSLDLGNELLSSAIKDNIGWSWNSMVNGIELAKQNLTGFSHGAAGIGSSLLELFYRTGDIEFREGAEQAFAYENHWFSKKEDNWPDFRTMKSFRDSRKSDELSYAVAWCHGSPGIGLARLRAYNILNNKIYLEDANAAIRTTVKFVKQDGIVHRANYSLCHGLAGNSECLIYASEILHNDYYQSLVNNLGVDGIDKYEEGSVPWPCGIESGQTPGLMVGLSGIGYFYLRLHDSSKIPSILMINQELI